jgi:hypothetical protein
MASVKEDVFEFGVDQPKHMGTAQESATAPG